MACALYGSGKCVEALKKIACENADLRIRVESVSCLGRCDRAPAVLVSRHEAGNEPIDDELFVGLGRSPERDLNDLGRQFGRKERPKADRDADIVDPARGAWEIDVYRRRPELKPYEAIRDLLGGERDAHLAGVVPTLRDATLVGLGGALGRTAEKWEKVSAETSDVKYVVCNGDESEPGTFKDREILLRTPHLVVEGMLIAAAVLRASRGYIYIRHEYGESIRAVRDAIETARRLVPSAFRGFDLRVFVSPGRYICGEQSALLEVLEDRRAQPRDAPPEIEKEGLNRKPTLVNNVETYAWVPGILLSGAWWYRRIGKRLFSICGEIRQPGVYELSVETTLRELIEVSGGGMAEGCEFAAVAPSGPSGGFLPRWMDSNAFRRTAAAKLAAMSRATGRAKRPAYEVARLQAFHDSLPETGPFDVRDLPLDGSLFRNLGLMLGAGIVVYGETSAAPFSDGKLLDQVRNCQEFFHKESCGKCVPCRLGCDQLVHLVDRLRENPQDRPRVDTVARELAEAMQATSICGLGRSAACNPLITALDYF
jgi:NADH:ubiquinone oxidoreductase subunit F (NADH-binding)